MVVGYGRVVLEEVRPPTSNPAHPRFVHFPQNCDANIYVKLPLFAKSGRKHDVILAEDDADTMPVVDCMTL